MAVQALLTPQPGPTGYFHRELLIRTPEGRRVDLLTVTDCHGILVGSCLALVSVHRRCPCTGWLGKAERSQRERYVFVVPMSRPK